MVKHVITTLKLKDLSASLKSIKGELNRNKEIKLKKNFLQDRSTCPKRMQPKGPTCIATRRETSLLLWRQLNSNILLFYNQVNLFWTFFYDQYPGAHHLLYMHASFGPSISILAAISSSSSSSSVLQALLCHIPWQSYWQYPTQTLFSIYAPRK